MANDPSIPSSTNPQYRYGKIEDLDKSYDISAWQSQGPKAIMDAAWQLVVDYYKFKGLNLSELRLQRSIEKFGKISR